ncbi:hypothetical protein [Streptomyces roseoverticillatus]|uniref:Transcriptional regulator n=1 Tax=Streptomyces roseoverticillatus TaxID=66429 RepID=A0ABV3IYA5_9ACTN
MEADWTQESLARAVNRVAKETGLSRTYDRTTVAHWLKGSQPRPPTERLIAEVLSRRLGRVITPEQAGLASTAQAGPQAGTAGFPPAGSRAAEHGEPDPLHDMAESFRPYEPEKAHVPPWQPGLESMADQMDAVSGTKHPEVAVLESAAQFYRVSYDAHGGEWLRGMLSDFLAGTVPGWMASARREAVRRELAAPCCKLTFLLAQMCADAGCHGAAQRHFTTAAQLAEAAGDQLMRAVVLRAMGTLAFSQGRRRSAMDYLEAGTSAVTSGDDARAVRAYLQAQLAVVHAADRNPAAALQALSTAERLAEATQAGDQLAHYPPAALSYQAAQVHTLLGQHARAADTLKRSLTLRPPQERRAIALTLAQRAALLVTLGHVDEACHVGHRLLDEYPHLQSRTLDCALRDLLQRLRPHGGLTTVRHVMERIQHPQQT